MSPDNGHPNEHLNGSPNGDSRAESNSGTPYDPKNTARRLAEKAWEADNPVEQAFTVAEALNLDPECPLALVVSARLENPDPLTQHEKLKAAMELAREEAGEDLISAHEEDLFANPKTRAYLIARHALTFCTAELTIPEDIVPELVELLNLDPQDHLGTSHQLLSWLILRGQDAEAYAIMEERPCSCPTWAYSRALLAYRKYHSMEDPAEEDREVLEDVLYEALDTDELVPKYLLGHRRIPKEPPTDTQMFLDDDAPAYTYAATAIEAWATTPGALAWLNQELLEVSARFVFSRDTRYETIALTALKASQEAYISHIAQQFQLSIDLYAAENFRALSILDVYEEVLTLVQNLAQDNCLTTDMAVEVTNEEFAAAFDELGLQVNMPPDNDHQGPY